MPASAKRILIAPLDWGLGHTTRCIPIIRALRSLGHKVLFAGEVWQQEYIRREFPDIDVRYLEGYRVRYSRRFVMFTIICQLPRLLKVIHREHRWLKQLVKDEHLDAIISDNRYGLWHKAKRSVIITHQPGLITGMGQWADAIARRLHFRLLNRFHNVWIPDAAGQENLAGSLSHPPELPAGAQYIGLLSRFEAAGKAQKHILILLSGPEPQRTILADKLWAQVEHLERPIVFVEGKAGVKRKDIPPHICHYDLADTAALLPLLQDASLVVCRSGYSTLMDLAVLRKPAIIIPTPGQTEQEYLARYLSRKRFFYTASQQDVLLKELVQVAETQQGTYRPSFTLHEKDALKATLDKWLKELE